MARPNRQHIKRILVITLSNLGDLILTTPVVEVLVREFPDARLDVIVGPNGAPIFERHPKIGEVIVYDKFMSLVNKIKLIVTLRRRRYSLIVDLRNTLFPYFIGAPYKSLPFKEFSRHVIHKKDVHLWKLKTMGISIGDPPHRLYIDDEDRSHVRNILKQLPYGKIVLINPGAKSSLKRWRERGFAYVVNKLKAQPGLNLIMIGSPEEKTIASSILAHVEKGKEVLNLAGKTTVRQLIALLEHADLLITNDTAPLHAASLLGKKALALFGPTNTQTYGPFSPGSVALQKPFQCAPCKKAHCSMKQECMSLLSGERVFEVAKAMLEGKVFEADALQPRRILLVRTDRIGDVALSTPAIKAVWKHFPNSFLACMVQPYARDIVEGNPYLDEVIVFDKKRDHGGIVGTYKFAQLVRSKKFDMVFILHPTARVHLITFLAGISQRIGYDKKMSFLLTTRIPHTKQEGKKHEMEYTLDVLRSVGIEPDDKKLLMPTDVRVQGRVEELLAANGIDHGDVIIGIHPGASCPSKRWTPERFAELADTIMRRYKVKIIVVTGPTDVGFGNDVIALSHEHLVHFAGTLSVKELAMLLKRCVLFISNDSGPVHIAVAVETPVIALFGRNEQGLSPRRWRPLGIRDLVIHKDVGCKRCLAHNCDKGFECLKRIETNDVMDAVAKFLT
jgi:heptosyltransferase-2